MDEALKGYARKRREQAEPVLQMHPATRNLLQGEVKRTLQVAQKQKPASSFLLRFPLGTLVGALAVFLLMLLVSRPATRSKLSSLAPIDSKPVTINEKKAVPDAVPAAEDKANSAESSAPGGAAGSLTTDSVAKDSELDKGSGARALKAKSYTPAAAASGAALAAPDNGSNIAQAAFVQVLSSPDESPPSNLLSNFSFSRAGQNVRIVDADGSIYDGQVVGGFGGAGEDSAKNNQPLQNTSLDATYAFKVAGTNRKLQQNVVFSGNLSNMPGPAMSGPISAQNRSGSQTQNALSNGLSQSSQAQNARITGKVQVGGGKEFKIEAKTPSP